MATGSYTLEIGVAGAENFLTTQVQVRKMPVLLIETDKPIYKPGQTIQGRVLVLTNELHQTVQKSTLRSPTARG